jgi:hypothetical protein
MALHRDIYWVGRQWAVTGLGVQAVDQRLKGAFDIEVGRLWEDDLPQRMRALAWLKADDFDKALELARARHPEPPRKSLPLVESILELIPLAARAEPPKPQVPPAKTSQPPKPLTSSTEARQASSVPTKSPVSPTEPAAPPPAAAPKPPVAPVEASVPESKPSKRPVTVIGPAPPPAAPPKPAAAPVETEAPASKPVVIEQPPAKFQPLALKIERASAKFLPRWRVRHR